jgi:homotetrameric cytidine deaminase
MSPIPQSALDSLLAEARTAAQNAYAPYSHFRVGSALLLSNGETVRGANVENASYGLTMCAERSALAAAVSQFGPEIRVAAVAVANLNDAASPPCGACRQMLSEFVLPDATVVFPFEGEMLIMPFSEVMPVAFDLKKK